MDCHPGAVFLGVIDHISYISHVGLALRNFLGFLNVMLYLVESKLTVGGFCCLLAQFWKSASLFMFNSTASHSQKIAIFTITTMRISNLA
jgi:hypothetical protein